MQNLTVFDPSRMKAKHNYIIIYNLSSYFQVDYLLNNYLGKDAFTAQYTDTSLCSSFILH